MSHKLSNLQGSMVAIVTPFTDDGLVDTESYDKLLDFHLANKTDAIVVCGTTGETPTLTHQEDFDLIERTVKKINGRIPVIAGAGSNCTKTAIDSCQEAQHIGADAVLVVGPYYNKPTTEGFYQHFKAVAEAITIPIIIYNVPGRTGKNIPTDVIIRLANEYENILGVKEASGNIEQMMDILNRKPARFKVYSGDDSFALPLMALGGEGCISVVANEIPLEFSQIMHYMLEGNYAKARELHFKYLKLMGLNFIESNPVPVKTALSMMGMIKENFRLPMCKIEESNRQKLENELKKLGLI